MAKKIAYVDRLIASHKALQKINAEKIDLDQVITLATTDGTKAICQNIMKRYDTDIAYLQKQRMYYVGKALEEKPTLFDAVLAQLVS